MFKFIQNLKSKLNWQKVNPLKWALKFKLIGLVIVILLVAGIWFWQSKKKANEPQIQTVPVQKGHLVNSLTLSGQVEQSNLISVASKASGVVNQVYVTDGQAIKAGQKLAEITLDSEGINNQSSAWASYLSAKTGLESAKTQLWTLESSMWQKHEDFESRALDNDLSVDDPIFIETQRDWLAAEANYINQKEVVAQRQAALSSSWYNYQLYQASITAPVNGTIIGLNLAEGLTISYSEGNAGGAASQTVATIRTSGKPIAAFNVTEVDIPKLQVSQPVQLSLDSYPNQAFQGTIAAVDRVGSATSGVTQYPVLISFEADDDRILTNMAVTADIILAEKADTLFVPNEAVTTIRDKTIVRQLVNGQPQPVEVEIGLVTDTYTEIVTGLNEGDLVITTGLVNFNLNGQNSSERNQGFGGGMPGMSGGMVRIRTR